MRAGATSGITGAATVAGVVGRPVGQSLSPAVHNAWIAALGLDAAYVPFSPADERFEAFVDSWRGGALAGLNVTIPFKERALALAHAASPQARRAGAANLLLFRADGTVEARNTDGDGVLGALAHDAPELDLASGPVVVLGAGGGARGAVGALLDAGAPQVRLMNRSRDRAEALAVELGPTVRVFGWDEAHAAFAGAALLINATSTEMSGGPALDLPLHALPERAVVLDMVFKPLETPLLKAARARGLATVDGLAMLIAQARPSFEALFGRAPPDLDVRALVVARLERAA